MLPNYFVKPYFLCLYPFPTFLKILIKEAPQAANIFGTYSEGPVFIGVECQSGLSFQYEANLVSLKCRFRYLCMFLSKKYIYIFLADLGPYQNDMDC